MTMIDVIKKHGATVDDDDNLIDIVDVIPEMINSIKGCIWRLTQQAHQYHVITELEDIADDMWSEAYHKKQARQILCGILEEKIEQLEELEAEVSKDAN